MNYRHHRRNHGLLSWKECFVCLDRWMRYRVGVDTVDIGDTAAGSVADSMEGPLVAVIGLVVLVIVLILVPVATLRWTTNIPEWAAWVPLVVGVWELLPLLLLQRLCIVCDGRSDHRHCSAWAELFGDTRAARVRILLWIDWPVVWAAASLSSWAGAVSL